MKILLLILIVVCCSACSVTKPGQARFHEAEKLGLNKEWRHNAVLTDIDADGYTDIVATHRKPLYENSLHIWLNKKGWQELPQEWASPGYSGIDVGDLNKDGRPDIVAGSHFNRIHTLLGTKPGTFSNSVLSTADGYAAARIIDLNGDGIMEAVLLGNEFAGIEIYNLEQDKLVLKETLMPNYIGRELEVIDMNNDNRPDLVASMSKVGVVIFLQQPGGRWLQAAPTKFESETREFRSMKVADLNKDGFPDIALNGGFSGVGRLNGPDVYLSDGAGSWKQSSSNLKLFKKPSEGIAVGDFNLDGNQDLLAGGNLSSTVKGSSFGLFLFSGNGKGGFKLADDSNLPESGLLRPYSITNADFNKDGKEDFISLHSDPEQDQGYISVFMSR